MRTSRNNGVMQRARPGWCSSGVELVRNAVAEGRPVVPRQLPESKRYTGTNLEPMSTTPRATHTLADGQLMPPTDI
jgi:hypothetical protein